MTWKNVQQCPKETERLTTFRKRIDDSHSLASMACGENGGIAQGSIQKIEPSLRFKIQEWWGNGQLVEISKVIRKLNFSRS
jgi:hypothetical protein